MFRILDRLGIFAIMYAVWILFTYSLGYQELAAGFVVCAIVAHITYKYTDFSLPRHIFNPMKLLNMLIFVAMLIKKELISHIKVAGCIISGNVNPAIVSFGMDGDTDLTKTLAANSITLTPGTVSISADKKLQVHCLDWKKGDDVCSTFSSYARRVFG